ncbi:hypothetical protein D3C86_1774630 [compost metagenome]
MRGQQVLHHVQTFSTVKVSWLARQYVKFVCSNGLLEAFTTLTRCGSPCDTLQLDNFCAFTGFLRDVVAGDFAAQHVIRSNVAYHFAFSGNAVKGDNRNIRLVCHLNGVTYSV